MLLILHDTLTLSISLVTLAHDLIGAAPYAAAIGACYRGLRWMDRVTGGGRNGG